MLIEKHYFVPTLTRRQSKQKQKCLKKVLKIPKFIKIFIESQRIHTKNRKKKIHQNEKKKNVEESWEDIENSLNHFIDVLEFL